MRTITYRRDIDGVLTDVTSAYLRDPAGTFGVRRTDTLAVVVPAGTPLAHVGVGLYEYSFTEPQPGLVYEYWLERTFGGETKRTRQTLQGSAAATVGGVIPTPPAVYVELGVETVSCGDATLAAWLNTQAALVWAMQARRPTLDLRFQYFLLDLLTLALDFVRTLIEQEIGTGQMTETGYANSSSVSDSAMENARTRTASSSASAVSSQSSIRSSSRTTTSAMQANSNQDSSRAGTGSDTSLQVQDTANDRDMTNDNVTTTTPYMHRTNTMVRTSSASSSSDSATHDDFTRVSHAYAFIGGFSAQTGKKEMLKGENQSKSNLSSLDTLTGDSTRGSSTVGNGDASDLATVVGVGTRTNNRQRTSTSVMNGSATATSSGSMTAVGHSEQHRTSSATSHSESAGHGTTTASASGHRQSTGASQMVSQNGSDHEYFNQIFESLQTLWDDTKAEIERLLKQVPLQNRYLVQKLSVRTPQAALVAVQAARTDFGIIQHPSVFGSLPPLLGFDPFTTQ